MRGQSASLRGPGATTRCHIDFVQVFSLWLGRTLLFLSVECLCNSYLSIFLLLFNISWLNNCSLIDLVIVNVADGGEALLLVLRVPVVLYDLLSVRVGAVRKGLGLLLR